MASAAMTMPCDPFTLPRVLSDIARHAGYELDLDDLVCTLGLPWLFCSVSSEPDVARWPMYARDAFLIPSARLFGIDIRAMHPPETARGLDRVAEFEQHFDASYRPLVHRALENGQAVLAWRGWSGGCDLMWGRITGACSEGAGFRGLVVVETGSDGRSMTCPTLLERPATQLYVVERITLKLPTRAELLKAVIEHASVALGSGLADRFGVVGGPAALEAWRANTLDASDGINRIDSCHDVALCIMAMQQAALRFLRRKGGPEGAAYAPVVSLFAREADNIMAILGGMRSIDRLAGWLSSPMGREIIASKIREIAAATSRMQTNLARWGVLIAEKSI